MRRSTEAMGVADALPVPMGESLLFVEAIAEAYARASEMGESGMEEWVGVSLDGERDSRSADGGPLTVGRLDIARISPSSRAVFSVKASNPSASAYRLRRCLLG